MVSIWFYVHFRKLGFTSVLRVVTYTSTVRALTFTFTFTALYFYVNLLLPLRALTYCGFTFGYVAYFWVLLSKRTYF